MREYKVLNVKCGGCANTLKSKLKEAGFGDVEVNLETMPRTIKIFQDDIDEAKLRTVLKKMGYPMEDENLGTFEEVTSKAKSFVSCAIGKMDS